MDDFGNFHVKVFYVNGLNMENERFVWNDKLLFVHSGSKSSNVAEAHIFVDSPIWNS